MYSPLLSREDYNMSEGSMQGIGSIPMQQLHLVGSPVHTHSGTPMSMPLPIAANAKQAYTMSLPVPVVPVASASAPSASAPHIVQVHPVSMAQHAQPYSHTTISYV